MRAIFYLFLLLAVPATGQKASKQLTALIESYESFQRRESRPTPSDTLGTGILGSFKEADFKRRADFYASLDLNLSKIKDAQLSQSEQISKALLRFICREQTENYRYKSYLIPLLADDGFHISYVFDMTSMLLNTPADYKRYILKLRDFPRYVQEHLDLLAEGIRTGMTQARAIFDGYEVTYKSHIVQTPETSLFYRPFKELPESFSESEKEKLRAGARAAIMEGVVAGYRLMADFMENQYIPHARAKEGIGSVPNGLAYYQSLADYYTTLNMPVADIHQKGLEEVARIRKEMEVVMRQTGFEGDLKAFIAFLRTDPQFYADSPEELIKEATYISKLADGRLPAFFSRLPRQPYGVEPVPDHLAPKYTGGRYSPSAPGSKRGGYYWVNTYNLPARPLYVLEALTLHEAVPGHHLQMALNYELTNVPNFRLNLYLSAYGEGWALYTEALGEEMGFYKNPYSKFGKLTYEMWRACRLVVDTGIHAYGWSREQAIAYLADHTALSMHECTTETDRYISWPGQALSYKIGELKIRELRKKAEKEMGERFDIRAFHDAILAQGTLTLPLLEQVVQEYIEVESRE
ncbi:MAG: DUF885 domain-containing protein [Saprospiraceae bacterium]|nr:DUF885 domain-containing protein [Saprospiraceae bacterium]